MVATNQKNLPSIENSIITFESTVEITDLSISTPIQPEIDDRLQNPKEEIAQVAVEQERSLLQLPSDFLKTPTTSYQPGFCRFTLPDRVRSFLRGSASQQGIDGRSLLLAAFNALLYRYTQQETIYLELTISDNKVSAYTAEICTLLQSQLKARELMADIAAALSEIQAKSAALQNQFLVDNSSNPASSSPIAITFVENFLCVEDKEQWITEFQQQPSEFANNRDLHLVILQQDQDISAILNYNASLFKPDTIERLAGHLQALMTGIVEDLDCPIAQLPLLTPAEAQQLLVEWKSASVQYSAAPIHQYIEDHALRQPDAIALTFKEQQLTYAELNQRANQLARYLISVGVGREVRVAVCVQPSLDIAVSLLGIFKAGGVYVPLDPTHPVDRLTAILEDTQPKILLTQSYLLPNLPAMVRERSATAEHLLCLDQDWATVHPFPTHNLETEILPDQTAYIIYTSGTTGKPKGVMASHSNLVNYILLAQERFGFNCDDVMPAIARFTFSITMFELLSPLVAGGRLIILDREHILDFKRMMQTLEQVTVLHTSPSLMQKLLVYIKDNGLNLQRFHGLRHVSSGGDMVPAQLLENLKTVFQNAEVYVIYGCSEVSCMGCTYPVTRDRQVTKSLVGKPFNNVSVRLYDPQQTLVPVGVPGEIYISGAGVTKGYLNRQELTQEKFVSIDGEWFYRTGDLGRFDAEGNLEILGRADFQIKLRGIRIELGEIESALRQAPGVREGVVVARELGTSEKSLVAYVVLNQAQNPPIEEIRRFLQVKLPDYMVPAAFVVLEAMPVNLNQKVDRRALPEPTPENLVGLKTIISARNDWEQQLVEIWEAAIGIQPIGIRNNFFELGGDSLMAVQIFTEIDKRWGKALPITTLLQAPTIEDLVKVMRSAGEEEILGDVVPLRSSGTKPPLFCLYGILIYQEMVNHLDPDQPVYGVFLQEEIELVKTGKFDPNNSVFSSVPNIAARYLQAIRSVQPYGPYYLAGESFGGVVAFEMAKQLQAVGEEVALIALFDSMAPNSHAHIPLMQRLKLHWQLLAKQGLAYPLQRVQKHAQSVQQYVQRKLSGTLQGVYQLLHPSTENMPQTFVEAVQQDIREEVRQRASRSYDPQPYSGNLVLFRAMERDAFEAEDYYDMGWRRLTDSLEVVEVPGDHLGILRDPHVRVLAEVISQKLAEGQQAPERELQQLVS